jgi:hypothetical protein
MLGLWPDAPRKAAQQVRQEGRRPRVPRGRSDRGRSCAQPTAGSSPRAPASPRRRPQPSGPARSSARRLAQRAVASRSVLPRAPRYRPRGLRGELTGSAAGTAVATWSRFAPVDLGPPSSMRRFGQEPLYHRSPSNRPHPSVPVVNGGLGGALRLVVAWMRTSNRRSVLGMCGFDRARTSRSASRGAVRPR